MDKDYIQIIYQKFFKGKTDQQQFENELRAHIHLITVQPREDRLQSLLALKAEGQTGLGKSIKDATIRLNAAQIKADGQFQYAMSKAMAIKQAYGKK